MTKPGEMVRVSKLKGNFEKGYLPNWSEEHFIVTKTLNKEKPVYKLKDHADEDIKGTWYPEEIQQIDTNRFLVEKILKTRNPQRKKKEYFVKWKGWPAKFNSWITASNLEQIGKHHV